MGSCLPRLGLSAPQLDAILNRSDTDTAYEAFVNLKASKEMEEKNPGVTLGEIKRKQPNKRKRDDESVGPGGPSRKEPGSAMASGTNTPEPLRPVGSLKTESIAATNPATMDSYSYLFHPYEAGYSRPGEVQGAGPAAGQQYGQGLGGQQNQGQGQMPFPYGPPPNSAMADQMRMYGMSPSGAMNMGMGMGMGGMGMPSPMYAPWNAAPFGDFGGFGLTVPGQGSGLTPFMPPVDAQLGSSSSAAVGAGSGNGRVSEGARQPPVQAQQGDNLTRARDGRSQSQGKDNEDRVRQALTAMMSSKGLADGRNMSAEEVDERVRVQKDLMEALTEDEGMRKRVEPFQLIAYHINKYVLNWFQSATLRIGRRSLEVRSDAPMQRPKLTSSFRINHAYVLPASLRPTAVQRTIPHEHAIDGVPFPSVRDRMILLRGRYDLIDAYQGLLQGVSPTLIISRTQRYLVIISSRKGVGRDIKGMMQ